MQVKKVSIFEQFIGTISPRTAVKRARARIALGQFNRLEAQIQRRGYEGADKSKRTSGWSTYSTDVNAEVFGSLGTLRNRSRDLVRNDGYASNGVQEIVDWTIGTGIILKPKGNKARIGKLALAWTAWAESIHCDYDGINDFYGLQALALRTIIEGGEVLIRRIRTVDKNGRVPLQLQILEGDFLDMYRNDALDGGGRIIQGVEFNAAGQRVAYWLFENHPGSRFPFLHSIQSKRYSADDIIHMFRVDRAGQVRGIPWAAPIILPMRDFNEYEDAQLLRQKIAACFTAFVTDVEDPDAGSKSDEFDGDRLEPGTIETLPLGRDIKFANPPGVDGYDKYSKQMLQRIAAGLQVPYIILTGDYAGMNYSSSKMALNPFWRRTDSYRWRIIVPRGLNVMFDWWKEAAMLAGINSEGVIPSWTPPKRESIDPAKEISAITSEIRSGTKTLTDALLEQGKDPEEHLRQYQEDNNLLDKLGITLDSDPRKTMKAGMTQPDVVNQKTAEADGSTSGDAGNA